MKPERFLYLMDRLVKKTLSEDEKAELRTILNEQQEDSLVETGVQTWFNDHVAGLKEQDVEEEVDRHLNSLFQMDRVKTVSESGFQPGNKTVHRVHFLRKWGWAAACLLVAAGVASWLFFNTGTTDPADNNSTAKKHTEEILPGKESALLSLADGSQVSLDTIRNGVVALQGGTTAKVINGKLIYEGKSGEVLYNTIKTPKGGQYQFNMPDGSKVWLNAASSITFPVAFVEKNRKVTVTGEAYFEISKDQSKPFILDIDGLSTVEVLGTSFNVNSYKGEPGIRTTLLEGQVKVKNRDQSRFALLARPGWQATTYADQPEIGLRANANIEQVMAWKNGLFNFEGADVKQLMRQLERWYDIDVRYEGETPSIEFEGKMYRDVPLSEVLKVLEKAGVKFRMEKRTIVIL